MIEWCAMISVLVCSEGFVFGGLRGDSIDLEGGVGCRVERKGSFSSGGEGRELWFSLKVLTPKS